MEALTIIKSIMETNDTFVLDTEITHVNRLHTIVLGQLKAIILS